MSSVTDECTQYQTSMNTWNLLRSREQGSNRQRHILQHHFYNKDVQDTVTEENNAERRWWNAVLVPERSVLLKDRSVLIRKCQTEISSQRRISNKKRKWDDRIEVVYDEIEID